MVSLGELQWLQHSQYFISILIFVAFIAIAKSFQHIFIKYVARLSARTESDIDDQIIRVASRPLFTLILLGGLYLAIITLPRIDAYMNYVNESFFVLLTLVLSWLVARVLSLLTTRWFQARRGLTGSPHLLNIIVSVVIYLAAIIIILSHFQIEITPFVAALGLGGLAVGLALQPTLSNIFAGVHLLGDQPIKVGDFIELLDNNLSGYVEDVGWRSTRIRTLPNNLVIIPNSKLAESTIVNNSLPSLEMSVRVQVGVDYSSDLSKVERVTIRVAKRVQKKVEGAIKDFEPFIRYHTFGDSNINFTVILRVEEPVAQYQVTHEFVKQLHKEYAKEGIEISWPIQKNYFLDPLEIRKTSRKTQKKRKG